MSNIVVNTRSLSFEQTRTTQLDDWASGDVGGEDCPEAEIVLKQGGFDGRRG